MLILIGCLKIEAKLTDRVCNFKNLQVDIHPS